MNPPHLVCVDCIADMAGPPSATGWRWFRGGQEVTQLPLALVLLSVSLGEDTYRLQDPQGAQRHPLAVTMLDNRPYCAIHAAALIFRHPGLSGPYYRDAARRP